MKRGTVGILESANMIEINKIHGVVDEQREVRAVKG